MDLHDAVGAIGGPTRDTPELPGLDSLYAAVAAGRPSDELEDLRAVLCRLPMLGPYNAMLVEVQRPGALYVATAWTWRHEFGRHPRPGARPLVILKPFMPVEFVYDVSETDGRPLPQGVMDPFRASGPVTEEGLSAFTGRLPDEAISYRETPFGSAQAGRTQTVGSWDPGRAPRKGEIRYAITVNDSTDPATRLATLFHELGHIYCGHLAGAGAQRHQRRALSPESQEFEAEIVSWLACGRLRIDSPSGRYLHGHLQPDGTMPPVSVQAVVHALGKVEAIAGGMRSLAAMVSGPPARDEEEPSAQEMLDFGAWEP